MHVVTTLALPLASREADAAQALSELAENTAAQPLVTSERAKKLIEASAGNSPFLARLLTRYPEQFSHYLEHGPDSAWHAIEVELNAVDPRATQNEVMKQLRELKGKTALTTALADIEGSWQLMRVTGALSHFAELAVKKVLRHLLLQAVAKGEINVPDAAEPEVGSGIIILGMGKLGGLELNYSSDIDLIVLYDAAKLPYTGAKNAQHFMSKIATDLVFMMQERTQEGYVFRTDLRLRPDPMSTPPAVTTAAALSYYETVGQNWERAAMIKARPISGDAQAAELYMRELVPFMWRKTLDFATIADIHSIKRQMNVGQKQIELPGHNIKTGVGGIREIEFFVATQQLVWGGRIPELRVKSTLAGLNKLTDYELVKPEVRDTLTKAYFYLRTLEHRLQMRNDAQTHALPTSEDDWREVSIFMGKETVPDFETSCMAVLNTVHDIYTDSMGDTAPLAVEGNLVFTGVEADPGTLKTLGDMGYQQAQRVSDIIQGWHRGHRRSTRSKRSRQVLTELVPALLTAMGKTANPDAAFFHFDDFLDRLPSGAQIFSLLLSRPELLGLLAMILGSAPALGDTLSKDPSLLDAVLESDFFLGLPDKQELEDLLTERIRYAHEYEQKMGYLRTFNNEKRFQAGVHLLKRLAPPKRIGAFLSDVAEIILQTTMQEVWHEYGKSANTPFAVVAFGKLGGREMTFGSDLDIIFLYDDAGEAASETRTHMARISQRLISALTLLTGEGRLYEVDSRLRPGGSDGPLATSLAAFDSYFAQTAWTYEHMALTRARVVATNSPEFAAQVEETIKKHVLKPRDHETVLKDVLDMRERIAKEFRTQNPWALKHIRGGMVDMDFIAQYLVLTHGAKHPEIWHRSARPVFETALANALLPTDVTEKLIAAKKFLSDLLSLLRLSAPGGVITDEAPEGLKRLLAEGMRVEDFASLKTQVMIHEDEASTAFATMANGDFAT